MNISKITPTIFPGLISTAKFVVCSYSQVVDMSELLTVLDPTVDHAPFGVFLYKI